MLRRILAMIGVLALSVAYLPGVLTDAAASSDPSCCNGALCPMHKFMQGQASCDGDAGHGGTLRSCPDNSQRFVAATVFLRVQPATLAAEALETSAPAAQILLPNSREPKVATPPPRTSLA